MILYDLSSFEPLDITCAYTCPDPVVLYGLRTSLSSKKSPHLCALNYTVNRGRWEAMLQLSGAGDERSPRMQPTTYFWHQGFQK